jgi:hypothetical protein
MSGGPRIDYCRSIVNYQFDKLVEISKMPEPTFTFTHIISPHEPYVFDSNGDIPEQGLSWQEAYIGQLKYVNTRVLELVDELQSGSEQPIIILQGDHGSFIDDLDVYWKENGKDFTNVVVSDPDLIQKRFGILNAMYLPGIGGNYDSIPRTPVNDFSFVFDLYFHTSYPALQDMCFIPPIRGGTQVLVDVTGALPKDVVQTEEVSQVEDNVNEVVAPVGGGTSSSHSEELKKAIQDFNDFFSKFD